jgi:hypothetical protein
MNKIIIHTGKHPAEKTAIHTETPFDKRYGFFAIVTEVHPKRNTVNLRMDTGRDINDVRVASLQWITFDQNKDYLTGQRRLPPLNSYVYCLMPSGEPSSAIVLCSVFPTADPNYNAFKVDSEDAEFIDEKVDSGGWKFTHDIRTGTRKIQNAPKKGDETISFEINQEEKSNNKIILKVYGNTFEFDQEKQGIKKTIKGDVSFSVEGTLMVTVKGDVKVKADGNADMEAGGDISIKSSKSGTFTIGNIIATMGAMISQLLQALISFKSIGSPATHTAPDLSAIAAQIKTKWDQVFK